MYVDLSIYVPIPILIYTPLPNYLSIHKMCYIKSGGKNPTEKHLLSRNCRATSGSKSEREGEEGGGMGLGCGGARNGGGDCGRGREI